MSAAVAHSAFEIITESLFFGVGAYLGRKHGLGPVHAFVCGVFGGIIFFAAKALAS